MFAVRDVYSPQDFAPDAPDAPDAPVETQTPAPLPVPVAGYDKAAADREALAHVLLLGCHHNDPWYLPDGKTERCHICHPGPNSSPRMWVGIDSKTGRLIVNDVVREQ